MVLAYWILVRVHLICHCWTCNSCHICNAKNSPKKMPSSFWKNKGKYSIQVFISWHGRKDMSNGVLKQLTLLSIQVSSLHGNEKRNKLWCGNFLRLFVVAKETKIIVIIDKPDFWSRYIKMLTQQKALRFWFNSFNFVLHIMLETFFYDKMRTYRHGTPL